MEYSVVTWNFFQNLHNFSSLNIEDLFQYFCFCIYCMFLSLGPDGMDLFYKYEIFPDTQTHFLYYSASSTQKVNYIASPIAIGHYKFSLSSSPLFSWRSIMVLIKLMYIIMVWWWWTPLVFSCLGRGKLFICPLILNDSFAEYSNLGCRSLLFMTLNISWQSLLACKVSFEKSADRLMGTPL